MTLGSHQRSVGKSQSHCTPPEIVQALGEFDLDPCACEPRPYNCAKHNWTEGGLDRPWVGRVWLNPPFDRYQVGAWLKRLAGHRSGTALLNARTETEWFSVAWEHATAMLFLSNRVHFLKPTGERQKANSGAPVVLVAFSNLDSDTLR